MTENKKKSLLDQAIDAFTDRDEKAAAEEAEKKLAAEKIKAEADHKAKAEAAAKAAIVKHVWTNQDTYAELAYKHYGSMKEAYWRLIYEHNKHIIGDHPNHIKTGTEIEIPPLPESWCIALED